MLNILLVLVAIAFLFLLNPLKPLDVGSPTKLDVKTQTQVDKIQTQALQQVNYAREMQRQEASTVDE